MAPEKKLFLTGASGLLGRSIYSTFITSGWNVYGVALSRIGINLQKLDITNHDDVNKAILDYHPDLIIHAAAQRFPDKVDSDPEGARIINVKATQNIVEVAASIGTPVLYISTDYVFDGKAGKPYTAEDEPNPINLYGKTKLEGEEATLTKTGNIVLRIPVLYGPVTSLKESAVTCLLEPLLEKSRSANISHLERRCPSHVDDVSYICLQLAKSLQNNIESGIFQWCGKEKMTKYEMVQRMAEIFNLPHSHVRPDTEKSSTSTTRPEDTEMDCSRLLQKGFGLHTPFSEGVRKVLQPWVPVSNSPV